VSIDAVYRCAEGEVPAAGCRLPAGAEDRIAVYDDLGRELVSTLAPPFVSTASLKRYGEVAKRRPGLDLRAEWVVRRWPGHGQVRWAQVFRAGIEQDDPRAGAPGPGAGADIVIDCDYRDFARFLVGAGPITNAGAPIRIEKGGVTELSCLAGLVLDETSLRHVALPAGIRDLLAVGLTNLAG
jgi:hypothetical protein